MCKYLINPMLPESLLSLGGCYLYEAPCVMSLRPRDLDFGHLFTSTRCHGTSFEGKELQGPGGDGDGQAGRGGKEVEEVLTFAERERQAANTTNWCWSRGGSRWMRWVAAWVATTRKSALSGALSSRCLASAATASRQSATVL